MSKDPCSGTDLYTALVKVHVSKDISVLVDFLIFPRFFKLQLDDFLSELKNLRSNFGFTDGPEIGLPHSTAMLDYENH